MSNVLIGIIGVILFIGLALAGALFLGSRFNDSRTQSEAARYVTEGSQISKAYEMFRVNEGAYPTGTDANGTAYDSDAQQAKLVELKTKGYLKSIPQGLSGSTSSTDGKWYVDADKGAAFSYLGTDDKSKKICIEARKQNGLGSGDPLACSDAAITNNDPCCSG